MNGPKPDPYSAEFRGEVDKLTPELQVLCDFVAHVIAQSGTVNSVGNGLYYVMESLNGAKLSKIKRVFWLIFDKLQATSILEGPPVKILSTSIQTFRNRMYQFGTPWITFYRKKEQEWKGKFKSNPRTPRVRKILRSDSNCDIDVKEGEEITFDKVQDVSKVIESSITKTFQKNSSGWETALKNVFEERDIFFLKLQDAQNEVDDISIQLHTANNDKDKAEKEARRAARACAAEQNARKRIRDDFVSKEQELRSRIETLENEKESWAQIANDLRQEIENLKSQLSREYNIRKNAIKDFEGFLNRLQSVETGESPVKKPRLGETLAAQGLTEIFPLPPSTSGSILMEE